MGRTEVDAHRIGGGWGNHISWFTFEERHVYGHKRTKPVVGDLLEADMESGRVAVFRFTAVECKSDPPDMFFGDVEDIGYKDELDMKEYK